MSNFSLFFFWYERPGRSPVRSRGGLETYLEVALAVKEEVLRFEVAVGDALAVEVFDAVEQLFEAAFDFAWAHASVEEVLVGGIVRVKSQENWGAI